MTIDEKVGDVKRLHCPNHYGLTTFKYVGMQGKNQIFSCDDCSLEDTYTAIINYNILLHQKPDAILDVSAVIE